MGDNGINLSSSQPGWKRKNYITLKSSSFWHSLQGPFLLITCKSEHPFFTLFLGDWFSVCLARLYCNICSAWWYKDTVMMALKRTWRGRFVCQDEKGEVIKMRKVKLFSMGHRKLFLESLSCLLRESLVLQLLFLHLSKTGLENILELDVSENKNKKKKKGIYIFSMYICMYPQTRLFLWMWSHLRVSWQKGLKFCHWNVRKPWIKQDIAQSSSDLF